MKELENGLATVSSSFSEIQVIELFNASILELLNA